MRIEVQRKGKAGGVAGASRAPVDCTRALLVLFVDDCGGLAHQFHAIIFSLSRPTFALTNLANPQQEREECRWVHGNGSRL